MQIIIHPQWAEAEALLARPVSDLGPFREKVAVMLAAIKAEGDAAVQRLSAQFDAHPPEQDLRVTDAELAGAEQQLSDALKAAIRQAYANIRRFHLTQSETPRVVETMPGVRCWRQSVAIERVGLYIPGGTAPLFSTVLMLGVPAQIAGCPEMVLCTPAQTGGVVHPAVLFAAQLCGIRRIFKLGGAQAIGAMAYGTATVPKVWKIFGPGNPWVTAAKQLVSLEGVAIDMPAGPSEVAVLADAGAHPAFVAADLLSQAEHGADSQVLFVSTDAGLVQQVQTELSRQLAALPRLDYAARALENSRALVVPDLTEGMRWINAYAPEHLILSVDRPETHIPYITNAGSVFLGHFTPESAGDYASGTNHTLPTAGYARAYAGVSVDSFIKKITFQEISPAGLRHLGPTVVEMARAEGLEAHAQAVVQRIAVLDDADIGPAVTPSADVAALVRPAILALKPYSSARDEFNLHDEQAGPTEPNIFIDANENSLGSPLAEDFSRYPDPQQWAVKKRLNAVKGVPETHIFLGNGSDEAIDLLMRAFCEPGLDNIIVLPPTYGMYAVQANIHGCAIREARLRPDFTPDAEAVLALADQRSKLLFLCSPNNPTGNCLPPDFVIDMLHRFPGVVVVDEAYADFSGQPSWSTRLADFPNLVVLQTLSKAWGLAALRLGMAFANPFIISILNKIKYPYNVNAATIRLVTEALEQPEKVQEKVQILLVERHRLEQELPQINCIEHVFPSDANFLLVRATDGDQLYTFLRSRHIITRNRGKEPHCANCLRLTVGSPAENTQLLAALRAFSAKAGQQQILVGH